MISMSHDALPLASTSPFTPPGRMPEANASAWSRALQLAGSQRWAASAASPLHEHISAATASVVRTVVSVAPRNAHAPAGRDGPVARADAPAIVPADAANDGMPSSIEAARPICLGREQDAGEAPPVRRCAPVNRPASEQQSLRVHVEGDAHGAAIWVGWDGPASTAPMEAVLAALGKRFAGLQVASLVCNGSLLYARPIRKENP
jgi:hypothetical protein